MYRFLILFTCLILSACSGQTKEEMLQEGNRLRDEGNFRGSIVLYRSALDKDGNYIQAREGLAEAYLLSGSLNKAENEYKKVQHLKPSDANVLLKLATVYLQSNQPEKALLELDNFHSANTETSESLLLNGRVFGATGDLSSAEAMFKKALQVDAKAIEPRLNLAKVYFQKKDFARAKDYLDEIISLDETETAAYYLLATIQTRDGKSDAAEAVYRDLLKVKPKELQALYMLGLLQMDRGDQIAAKDSIAKLKAQFPDRPEGSRLQGLLEYRQNEFDAAILSLSNSLKTQQHLLSYFFLGLSYFGLEQFELALNQFQKALDLNPEFERARILVAMTLFKQKRLDDAVIEIKKVLRSNPGNAYAHNILGSILLANGDYDNGMAELDAATELDPTLADAHLKRGLFHLAKGEGAQGEADLIKAIDASPEVLNSRLMLVTHYLRQKNFSAAIEVLQEGLDGSESDALLYNYLAAAYFSQKKMEQAVGALKRAIELKPDYLSPYFNLASFYSSQSDYNAAITEYQNIIAQDPNNLRAFLGLASLYSVQGLNDEVESTFQKIEVLGLEDAYLAVVSYRLKQKDIAGALTVVNKGLEGYNSSSGLLETKGGLHLQLKQAAEAEAAFMHLAAVNPERGNQFLVKFYLQSKQADKAQQLVDSLLQNESGKSYPYLLAAGLFASKQHLTEAVEILQKGIANVANPLQLQMQLARVLDAAGNTSQAEQVLNRILEKSPRFAPAMTSLGFIEEKKGDKGKALARYRAAIKYDQKDISALNNAAYLLMDNFGQAEEALDFALKAYRLRPSDPRIMDTLGYILLQNDRHQEAHNLLAKAQELLPKIPTIKLHLALAKVELQKRDEARELLKQVIDEGGQAESQQAQKILKTL